MQKITPFLWFDDNAEEVTELIEEKKFDDANKLLNDFNYNDLVRESDYISLNNLIDRKRADYAKEQAYEKKIGKEKDSLLKTLNRGIDDRNLNRAWTAYKELNKIHALDRVISNDGYGNIYLAKDSLKELLWKISDTRILKKYSEGDPKQKLEWGEEYIKNYPHGDQAFNIASYIIGRRADVLMNNLMFEEKPAKVLEDFENLNNVLKTEVNGVNIKKIISLKNLDSLANKYIKAKAYEKSASELIVGDWAVITANDINWSEKGYINDRRNAVDLGTRGRVIGTIQSSIDTSDTSATAAYENGHIKLILEFPNIEEINWKAGWDIIYPYAGQHFGGEYYTNGKAGFLDTEVKGIPHISGAYVEMMKKYLATTKELIENYNTRKADVPTSEVAQTDSVAVPTGNVN